MRACTLLLAVSGILVADVLGTEHFDHAEAGQNLASTLMHNFPVEPMLPPLDQQLKHKQVLDAHIQTFCATGLLSSEECQKLARRNDPDSDLAVDGLNKMCHIIAQENCAELFADQDEKNIYVEGFRHSLERQMQAYCGKQIAWACELLGSSGNPAGHISRRAQISADGALLDFVQGLCAQMPEDACDGDLLEPRSQDEPPSPPLAQLNSICNRIGEKDCKSLFETRQNADPTARQFIEGLAQELTQRCTNGTDQACSILQELGLPKMALKRQASTQTTSSLPASGISATTIIKTITRTVEASCLFARVDDPNVSTVFMANVSGSIVQITADAQPLDASRMLALPAQPMGTMFPIAVDSDYLGDLLRFSMDSEALEKSQYHLLHTPLHLLKASNSHLDWDEVGRLGAFLQKNRKDISTETALKHAVAFSLQSDKKPSSQSHLTATVNTEDGISDTIVSLIGTTFTMTAPTQTVNGDVFIAKATAAPFDPHHGALHPDEKPPACKKSRFGRDCRVQKCMLRHHKPIDIMTVFPAVLRRDTQGEDDMAQLSIGYFTQATAITTAHWGTTKANKLYYPATASWKTDKDGSQVKTMIRQTPGPRHLEFLSKSFIAGNPKCFDYDSCCKECAEHPGHDFFSPSNYLMWLSGFAMLGTLSFIGLLTLCCCGGFLRGHRNRKRDPTLSRWEAIPVVGRAFRSEKVDPNAGSDVAQVVTIVPAAAADAGGAPVATVVEGVQTPGDGRGTLGRQAEEGRSRVNFADATQPAQPATVLSTPTPGRNGSSTVVENGSQSGATVVPTTVVTNSEGTVAGSGHETAPQVQPSPEVHRVDGAADVRTGSEIADMGSMRGRKKSARKDMKGFFNLPAV